MTDSSVASASTFPAVCGAWSGATSIIEQIEETTEEVAEAQKEEVAEPQKEEVAERQKEEVAKPQKEEVAELYSTSRSLQPVHSIRDGHHTFR